MFFIKCTSFWVLRQPLSCFCGEREKGFLAGESRRRSSSPRVFHLPGDQIRLRCGHTWCASLPARDSETLSRGSLAFLHSTAMMKSAPNVRVSSSTPKPCRPLCHTQPGGETHSCVLSLRQLGRLVTPANRRLH